MMFASQICPIDKYLINFKYLIIFEILLFILFKLKKTNKYTVSLLFELFFLIILSHFDLSTNKSNNYWIEIKLIALRNKRRMVIYNREKTRNMSKISLSYNIVLDLFV